MLPWLVVRKGKPKGTSKNAISYRYSLLYWPPYREPLRTYIGLEYGCFAADKHLLQYIK
jgi:hypothetical protein